MFKGIKKVIEKLDKEFMSHIHKEIQDLVKENKEISLEVYKELRINSYERKYIEPYLSDEALVHKIKYALNNSSTLTKYELPKHYTEYLHTDGIEELLKRFTRKCTWKKENNESEYPMYNTSCNREVVAYKHHFIMYDYCPYCGSKIVEEL